MNNTVKVSRRRVNALVVERLEALAKKQRLRMPVPRLSPANAARLASMTAQRKAWQKKSLAAETHSLTESICLRACTRKRPSFGKEVGHAKWRCLDRSEARLLRLVQAWAVTEAQKEASGL